MAMRKLTSPDESFEHWKSMWYMEHTKPSLNLLAFVSSDSNSSSNQDDATGSTAADAFTGILRLERSESTARKDQLQVWGVCALSSFAARCFHCE